MARWVADALGRPMLDGVINLLRRQPAPLVRRVAGLAATPPARGGGGGRGGTGGGSAEGG